MAPVKEMNTRIREHADALYVKDLHAIATGRTREASELARTLSQRGVTNSGIAQGCQISLAADVGTSRLVSASI